MIKVLISRVAILFFLSGTFLVEAETKITGTVRDTFGNTLAHASVEAIPVRARSSGGTVGDFPNPWVAADSSGNFTLNLAPGRYRIRAKDEVDGYPDPSFWLNLDPKSKRRFPEVAVGDEEIRDVEVVVDLKGGILTGKVQDAQTRKSLAGATVRIQDAGNPKAYVGLSTDATGRFHYTILAKPVVISAEARGYKVTTFQNGAQVTLSPGEHREIELELEHE